jgi:hypothetical protein
MLYLSVPASFALPLVVMGCLWVRLVAPAVLLGPIPLCTGNSLLTRGFQTYFASAPMPASKCPIVPDGLLFHPGCHVAIGVILTRVVCSRTGPVDLTMVYSGVSSSVVWYVERSIPTSLLLPIERTIPNSVLLFQSWIECNCTLSRAQ